MSGVGALLSGPSSSPLNSGALDGTVAADCCKGGNGWSFIPEGEQSP